MADNVAVTAGSGTTIATDERTINSVAAQVQRVDEQGSTAIASGQTNVTNSAATLIAARDTRKRVIFVNRQLAAVFVGPATVTTANGFQIDPGASLTLYTTALIQGITAAASGATEYVHSVEEYDS
jgi:hypothetical protein